MFWSSAQILCETQPFGFFRVDSRTLILQLQQQEADKLSAKHRVVGWKELYFAAHLLKHPVFIPLKDI